MGLRDLGFWGRMAAEIADAGLDHAGARRCAARGHKWRDVSAIVLTKDGGAYEAPRGTMQRCRRCGATRPKPTDNA
jgi:hypothetical protein